MKKLLAAVIAAVICVLVPFGALAAHSDVDIEISNFEQSNANVQARLAQLESKYSFTYDRQRNTDEITEEVLDALEEYMVQSEADQAQRKIEASQNKIEISASDLKARGVQQYTDSWTNLIHLGMIGNMSWWADEQLSGVVNGIPQYYFANGGVNDVYLTGVTTQGENVSVIYSRMIYGSSYRPNDSIQPYSRVLAKGYIPLLPSSGYWISQEQDWYGRTVVLV